MSILIQKTDRYNEYYGWFGVLGNDNKNIRISEFREIYAVYKFKDNRVYSYISGIEEDYLQGFTDFEIGESYKIILKKGKGSIELKDFTIGSNSTSKLVCEQSGSILEQIDEQSLFSYQQSSEQYTYLFGWYGVVHEDCQDDTFDLTTLPEIFSVITYENGLPKTYHYSYEEYLQSFTKLEIGKCYLIILKPGTKNIKINNFVSNDNANSNLYKFKIRKKIKVFVALWNFKNIFGNISSKFADNKYYLGKTDNTGSPIKTELKVSDIQDMLNKQNYVYPEQPEFEKKITGSVTDYFKKISLQHLDFEFVLLNLGNNKESSDPDDWAYSVLDRTKINKSSELKVDLINTFRKARYEYMDSKFPLQYDKDYENFQRNTAFGIVIHCESSSKIRSRNLLCDTQGTGITRKMAICNIIDKANSNRLEPVGVHIHEIIHSFDLKDLYSEQVTAMSKIDTMGYGFWGYSKSSSGKYFPFYPSAYTRYKIFKFINRNFNVINITTSVKDVKINPTGKSESIYRIISKNGNDIWYLDNRSSFGNESCINYDQELVESGLSIVHEYTKLFDQRKYIPFHKRGESGLTVSLEQQDGLFQLQDTDRDVIELDESQIADNRSDFFKEGDEFSPHTIPSSVTYEGNPSGIRIHNIRRQSDNSLLLDVTYLEEPEYKILSVNYYTESISPSNLIPQTCGGRRNCNPTENSPFQFNFKNVSYNDKKILIEIKTENLPDGVNISILYLKKDAVEYTSPGKWSLGSVKNNRVVMEIPKGLINLYLLNKKNHFIYRVESENYKDAFWYIDFIESIY